MLLLGKKVNLFRVPALRREACLKFEPCVSLLRDGLRSYGSLAMWLERAMITCV